MNNDRQRQLQQAIAQLPRVQLGYRQTPLEAMPRFSAQLGGPQLYIKRDDLTGLAFGGNKTRMLEFSLADAVAHGAEVIVFGAAVQSNYCRQLAAGCAKLGIELHLLLRPERPIDREEIQGNHLLQRLLGAQVTILESNDRTQQQAAIAARAAELRSQGRMVYLPRRPETVDLDAIAYAEAALEIVQQCGAQGIAPHLLYTAALDTTQAGLVLGLAYLQSPIRVRGFSPFQGMSDRTQRMAALANQAARRLGLEIELTAADFDNDDSMVGERYGVPTPAGMEAIRLLARSEGILTDPVYTGKALAGLISHIRQGKVTPGAPVLFMHTGGAPALFGYAHDLFADGA